MMQFLHSLLQTISRLDAPPARAKRSDLFADVPVVNQFGQQFRFKRDLIAGRAVIINTMFTICRGTCPGTSETLERLRVPLSKLFGKRVSMLSITIDPETDTPAMLQAYAEVYGAGKAAAPDQCDWHFLNAGAQTETLRRSLGFYDLNAEIDQDVTQHAALLFFGNDTTDRWATSPVQLRDGLIFEPLRRVLGVSVQERFGIQL